MAFVTMNELFGRMWLRLYIFVPFVHSYLQVYTPFRPKNSFVFADFNVFLRNSEFQFSCNDSSFVITTFYVTNQP